MLTNPRHAGFIVLAVTVAAVLATGVGTLLYAGFDAKTAAQATSFSPGSALVLTAGSDASTAALGLWANTNEGRAQWSAGSLLLPNDSVALPRLALSYDYDPRVSRGLPHPGRSGLDIVAFVSACGDSSQAIAPRCADVTTGDEERDLSHPAALFAALPQNWSAATSACAGAACRSLLASAPQGGNGSAGVYASLAGRFDVSAAPQLQSLPAPQSGWFDLGYTSPANPQWKQSLGVLCEGARPASTSALGVQCGLPSALNIGIWRMAFQAAGFEGAFSARDWHVNVGNDNGISVLVASAMQTPLDDFDVEPSWGMQVNVPGGFHLIGTSSGVNLIQADVSFGQIFAGAAPQGSFGGVQFDGDTISGNITGLSSADQTQIIGDVNLRLGDFNLSSGLSTSDFNLAVSHVLRNRATMQLSWSSTDGFGTAYMIPGGPTARMSWSNDNGFKIAVISLIDLGMPPVAVAPQGGMALGFTPPVAFNSAPPSVDFRLPFAAAAPPGSGTSVPSSASATVIIRLCVDGTADSACRPAEVRGPLQVSVDGQLAAATGGRVLVSPGYHVITAPVELLPGRFVALGALGCNLTVAASTVSFCDLPVHNAAP